MRATLLVLGFFVQCGVREPYDIGDVRTKDRCLSRLRRQKQEKFDISFGSRNRRMREADRR